MNREEMPRIRLKVATTAGINILCTALRKWRVAQWLPHIEEAFREVKEDQAEDQHSKKTFIKALRLKKGDFYIANSEVIGDVFEDYDQVLCEIDYPAHNKKQIKEQKKNKKAEPKKDTEKAAKQKNKKAQILNPQDQPTKERDLPQTKPKKKVKVEDKVQKIVHSSPPKQLIEDESSQKGEKSVQLQHKQQQQVHQTPKLKQKKPSQRKKTDKQSNSISQKFVKIDLSKLKSLLIKSQKKQPPLAVNPQPVPIDSEQSHSQNSS